MYYDCSSTRHAGCVASSVGRLKDILVDVLEILHCIVALERGSSEIVGKQLQSSWYQITDYPKTYNTRIGDEHH